MTIPSDKMAALIRLAETLERSARELRELAEGREPRSHRTSPALPDHFVDSLKASDRSSAVEQLSSLSHAQLGDVFTKVGGASRDKKRSKEWLIERILWYVFDFQAGHDIIKGVR